VGIGSPRAVPKGHGMEVALAVQALIILWLLLKFVFNGDA
jgi:hypothetical protein